MCFSFFVRVLCVCACVLACMRMYIRVCVLITCLNFRSTMYIPGVFQS